MLYKPSLSFRIKSFYVWHYLKNLVIIYYYLGSLALFKSDTNLRIIFSGCINQAQIQVWYIKYKITVLFLKPSNMYMKI